MAPIHSGKVATLLTVMPVLNPLVAESVAPNVTVLAGTDPSGKLAVDVIRPVVKSYLLIVTTGIICKSVSWVGIPAPKI